MTRHLVAADGTLTDTSGAAITPQVIDSTRLHVAHLAPHILTVDLPKGDRVNILVEYSCHCWTRTFDTAEHAGQIQIMDGIRPRVFCPHRFAASKDLAELLGILPQNRLYLTPSDRNYGTYNATMMLDDGTAYTAFFTLRPHKGRFDGIRHKLRLFVESAHHRPQPENGQKVKIAVVIGQALKGKKVKYFRR
ncbi:hypothetical protein RPE78_05550 [Thioclava litoralis]|uniref:Uncharacterized protein n=1 Tax=Thioclava litoralis TaxID=3076557 RepID=A0ABZ1E453_9RHOB|nr:hypothetical protein RPE78_05550 [Thioclava sp. FTW29]